MPVMKRNDDSFLELLKAPSLKGQGPLSQQLVNYLKEQIIQFKIKPDTSLSENILCKFFGVSRQPVREALLRLTYCGLVKIYSQRGTFVTRISINKVRRALLIREAVDVELVKRASRKPNVDFLNQLNLELTLQRSFCKEKDLTGFYQSDHKFHRIISDHGSVKGTWKDLEDLLTDLDRVRYIDVKTEQGLEQLVDEHANIIEAIAKKKAALAEKHMRDHLARAVKKIETISKKMPHVFNMDE